MSSERSSPSALPSRQEMLEFIDNPDHKRAKLMRITPGGSCFGKLLRSSNLVPQRCNESSTNGSCAGLSTRCVNFVNV
jgi:hypothetical protein